MLNGLKELLCKSFPNATKDIGDYTNKERNVYLVGMFGQNLIYAIIGSVLQVFYTDILIIPPLALTIIMGVSRIWDALNDIFMGTVVDKTHTRWGKCRPYLKFVPMPVALMTIILFLPLTDIPVAAKIIFVIFSYLLWESIYTLGDIPLWGVTSLMTPDEQKRAKLISAARTVSSVGSIIIVAFYPIKDLFGAIDLGLFANTGKANSDLAYFSEPQGYLLAVAAIALVGGILFRLPFPFIRERITQAPKEKDRSFKENLRIMWQNKLFIRAMIANILGCTKTLMLTAGMYFCKWVYGNGGDETLWLVKLGGPFLVGMIIAMNISTKVAAKFGKKKTYLVTAYLNAVPYILIFFVGFEHILFMAVMLFISGFLTGFSTVYNTTMVADSIDYMEHKTGVRNDGVFFSGLNFVSKLTAAITAIVTNGVLATVNYEDTIKTLGAAIENAANLGQTYTLNFSQSYPDITMALLILITFIPAAGCVLQALPIHGYNLSEAEHEKILDELKEMRKANERV